MISQFGWQFEKQFYAKDSGVAVLNEWVVLLGGLDQGVTLPSLSWLVGMRTANGTEFGVGPNLSAVGRRARLCGGHHAASGLPERADEHRGGAVASRACASAF